jgi:peptidoglycan hydrolase-like protein with peptidoglycan-binding domain
MMPNPGQPTIGPGATGKAVRRLQRALRRTPNPSLPVDGVFGPQLEAAVRDFQEGAGLVVDGIVGPLTWNALPDGRPMPINKGRFPSPISAGIALHHGETAYGNVGSGVRLDFTVIGPDVNLASRSLSSTRFWASRC